MAEEVYDCVIVGGGPAGLSAALILGRCRRRVLVCDTGRPRNRHAAALHGFLTRDGTPPLELLAIARDQLQPYPSVSFRAVEVLAGRCASAGVRFEIDLSDGAQVPARTLLIATGVVDVLPPLPGLDALYGRSVHHCQYCDGWEHRDEPLAIYGRGKGGAGLALNLTGWSSDLVLCTDGPPRLRPADRALLAQHGIPVRSERIAALEGHDGQLEHIRFANGDTLPRRALFVHTAQHQHSPLAAQLGCRVNTKGSLETGKYESTNIPGLFVAGDASRDVQLVIIAAAEGANAAFAINKTLHAEHLQRVAAQSTELTRRSMPDV